MGHWGVGPFQNDYAGDWFDPIRAQIREALRAFMEDADEEEDDEGQTTAHDHARAGAALVAGCPQAFTDEDLIAAIEVLEELRASEAWLGQWEDGHRRQIMRLLNADLSKLDEVLRRRRKHTTSRERSLA